MNEKFRDYMVSVVMSMDDGHFYSHQFIFPVITVVPRRFPWKQDQRCPGWSNPAGR